MSERVREIQLKRAREAALEAEQMLRRESEAETANAPAKSADETEAPHLGLVPPQLDLAELNPLVVAALRRIERARRSPPPNVSAARTGASGAATAVARVIEENYEQFVEPLQPPVAPPPPPLLTPPAVTAATVATPTPTTPNAAATRPAETKNAAADQADKSVEAARSSNLVIVPTPQEPIAVGFAQEARPASEKRSDPAATPTKSNSPDTAAAAAAAATAVENKPAPRRVSAGVIDDSVLERLDAELDALAKPAREAFDDFAPLTARLVGGIIDALVIVFIASPFAAIIELSSGNWSDPRVAASMAGIFVVIMFLYLTGSVALAGRTWGMSLVSLRAVDAQTALAPTTGQCARRAVLYILSLATFGLGLLYAVLDPENRTLHDYLSGTIVVRD